MKITVVGLGIAGVSQLTLAGVEHIRMADKVLYFPAAGDALERLLWDWNVKRSESLVSYYHDGERDNDNYYRVFDKLISDAREFNSVVFIVPGHPRLGVSVVQWLEARQGELGYELEVLPGISSFCTMINDLKRDPIERGSVLLDANRLLLFDLPMEPAIDYYLYHVCSVGTARVHLRDAARDNRIDLLQHHLRRFYPSEHRVTLIGSSVSPGASPTLVESTIQCLPELLSKLHFGTSLFVPSVYRPAVKTEFLQLLRVI